MTSLFLIALASGSMGAITAVATADTETKESLRKELTGGENEIMQMCEKCAEHIEKNDLRIDASLMKSPAMKVCEKITLMKGKALKRLIKKFLKSPKIDVEKLRALATMCENDDSQLCEAVKESLPKEEMLSEDNIRDCAEDVSHAYRKLKLNIPKDKWMSAPDFKWTSESDEVASRISSYSDL